MQFLCIIGCDAGVEQLRRDHPEVEIITAAIDPILNDQGYIVPGLLLRHGLNRGAEAARTLIKMRQASLDSTGAFDV
jgi:hypothetical protein